MSSPATSEKDTPASSADFSLQGPILSPDAFRRISSIAMREAGLSISENKADMVRTRLARRLRVTGLRDYESYCRYIESAEGTHERAHFVSALTTNVSHFFRERHHFDILTQEVVPDLRAKALSGKSIRLWSAGCANGQEPYSVAMVLADAQLGISENCRILATDIDPEVVKFARAGRYPQNMLGELKSSDLDRFFGPAEGGTHRICEEIRTAVSFRVLNLLKPWPMKGSFDVVFCRNVVIYFDKATQDRLWARFADVIAPGGWLFLGHSERISPQAAPLFEKAHITAYRRTNTPSHDMGKES